VGLVMEVKGWPFKAKMTSPRCNRVALGPLDRGLPLTSAPASNLGMGIPLPMVSWEKYMEKASRRLNMTPPDNTMALSVHGLF